MTDQKEMSDDAIKAVALHTFVRLVKEKQPERRADDLERAVNSVPSSQRWSMVGEVLGRFVALIDALEGIDPRNSRFVREVRDQAVFQDITKGNE